MKKLGIGIIGTGMISAWHIHCIRNSPDAELVALCDIDAQVLAEVGEKYGVSQDRLFGSYRDLLRCPDVDAVSICTPNNTQLSKCKDILRLQSSTGSVVSLGTPLVSTIRRSLYRFI